MGDIIAVVGYLADDRLIASDGPKRGRQAKLRKSGFGKLIQFRSY